MIAENSRTLIATKMMPCSFRDFTHVTAPINSLKKAINITLSQHIGCPRSLVHFYVVNCYIKIRTRLLEHIGPGHMQLLLTV